MKSILEKLNETTINNLIGRNLNTIGLNNVFIKEIVKDNINGKLLRQFFKNENEYKLYNDTVKPGTDFEIDYSGATKYILALCEFPNSRDLKYVAIEKKFVDELLKRSNIRAELFKFIETSINKYGKKEVYDAIEDMKNALGTNEWQNAFNKN